MLKEANSDGASAVAKPKIEAEIMSKYSFCEKMINIHYTCHIFALVGADNTT